MENLIKMDDLVVPLFSETSIYILYTPYSTPYNSTTLHLMFHGIHQGARGFADTFSAS